MTQENIRQYYERTWKNSDESAADENGLTYSSPVEDAVLYPLYQQLLDDLKVKVNGGDILDVGSGSGRWVRYFLQRFKPASILGVDFAQSAVDLLTRRYSAGTISADFQAVDVTQPELDLDRKFDLINVMNVLFHIPEADRFTHALRNLASHLSAGGRIVTTEYLPRQTMRTNWMLVRSGHEFETAVQTAGLRIIAVKACSFFSNDPMGLDSGDARLREQFNTVRAGMNQILTNRSSFDAKAFFVKFLSDVESATLNFCKQHMPERDLPSQKLVVLGSSK